MNTLAAGVRPAKIEAQVPANDNDPSGPSPSGATTSPTELLRIRVALIERINAAAQKALWGRNPESEGMPSRLFAAGCYLAARGYDEIACEGERWFNVDFAAYRSFAGFADMIELGRKAIYEGGRRAIAPLQPMEMVA